MYDPPLGKFGLEGLMKCSILCYARVGDTTYKVKIKTCQLKAVVDNSRVGCYFVDTWKCRLAASTRISASRCSRYEANTTETLPLKITSWNCRGLSNSTPYLNNLISNGSDIIVISEHWLWPFELHRLNEIHSDFIGHGQADASLTSSSDGRGLGGVGIIWRRDLNVSVVHASTSDRICCIRMTHQSSNLILSLIGVYLPCQDLGIDLYRNCLTELEQLVIESKRMGPTVVMGDFNAHLGSLGGPRGCSNPNFQGYLLQQHILKCDVFAASQSEYAFGPTHTFQRGDVRTTIDYILMDVNAASLLESCGTLDDDDLNTSDHLPQTVQLEFPCKPTDPLESCRIKINWSNIESTGALALYQSEICAYRCVRTAPKIKPHSNWFETGSRQCAFNPV